MHVSSEQFANGRADRAEADSATYRWDLPQNAVKPPICHCVFPTNPWRHALDQPFSVARMRELLQYLRDLADVGHIRFTIASAFPPASAPLSRSAQIGRLPAILSAASKNVRKSAAAEVYQWLTQDGHDNSFCGWLQDGRLAVVLIVASERTKAAADNGQHLNADWESDQIVRIQHAFEMAEFTEIRTDQYPLEPIAASDPSESISGHVSFPEGGIEEYIVQPSAWWKRVLDVGVAITALIVLAPLMAVVAVAIRLTSRGPVIYRQKRTGRGGRPFMMKKFRSMVDGAHQMQDRLRCLNEQDGPAFKIKRDPRVTRLGAILRTTAIDELPQMWNVLRGEMSIVGPRPLPCRESAACHSWQRRRLEALPGITGMWQVRGRQLTNFDQWMLLDWEYVRKQSLGLDLYIILATIPSLIFAPRKASNEKVSQLPGHAAASRQAPLTVRQLLGGATSSPIAEKELDSRHRPFEDRGGLPSRESAAMTRTDAAQSVAKNHLGPAATVAHTAGTCRVCHRLVEDSGIEDEASSHPVVHLG